MYKLLSVIKAMAGYLNLFYMQVLEVTKGLEKLSFSINT